MVVEGGNLGFTQTARIEYALAGGRINTDAIDNSAGVDMSDHEVNLKILLEPSVARGDLTPDDRNATLAACADEVAERVITDNRDQVLSLSLEQARSRMATSIFYDHMKTIDERGLLRHHEPVLPTREALDERRLRYAGLTRPELAMITAFTKIDLVQILETTRVVDDPYLIGRFLRPYFPTSMVSRFEAEIGKHRLRRELVATEAANELVDLMGSTFVHSMTREFGARPAQAVRGWLIGAEILDINTRAMALKANASTMSAEAEIEAFLALERACRAATGWVLDNVDGAVAVGEAISRFKPPFDSLLETFELMLLGGERDRLEHVYRELRGTVSDGELAHALARLVFADHLLTIVGLAFKRDEAADRVMEAYFGLSARLDFAILEQGLQSVVSDDRWIQRAMQELAAELRAARVALCDAVLDGAQVSIDNAFKQLRAAREERFAEVDRLFVELAAMPTVTPAAMQVTIRAITRLARPD